MSKNTKLILKLIAILLVLLSLGIRWRFVIIPSLSISEFWLAVSACFLLLSAGD